MDRPQNIYDYITQEENNYKLPIDIMGWNWSMADQIKTTFYYKHGRLLTGNQDDKPVKNIIRPILNLQYRTEDIDVKDIILYVEDEDLYHLSFLVKKYHDDVFVKENDLDTFWDNVNRSRIDYGGGLIQNTGKASPDYIPLEQIVFCDQTNMLSGVICFALYLSPDELLEKKSMHWGDENYGATVTLEELITLAERHKQDDKNGTINITPGKYIKVNVVHGTLPTSFLKDEPDGEDEVYTPQLQIVAFYQKEGGEAEGVTLFKAKDKPIREKFKLALRDPIEGRALGFGGAEELFEPQVWVNYDQIRLKDLLDAASKTIIETDDPDLRARHPGGLKNLNNLEIVVKGEGKTVKQLDNFPRNAALFEKSIQEWETHAQQMGAANDSIMGETPNSGTPFKLQELVTQESHGLHEYRRGQFAKFVEEVYRDWILPHISRKITQGTKFLSSLSLEEMEKVVESVVNTETGKYIKELTLTGQVFTEQEKEIYKQKIREDFMKDNNKFIEILKGELKDANLNISINVAGKQKALAAQVDKLVNVFRQIAQAPQVLDDPRMAKLFNQILENSGLSPIDFGSFKTTQLQQPQMMQQPQATPQQTQPMQQLSNNQQV